MKNYLSFLLVPLFLLTSFSAYAGNDNDDKNIVLYFDGVPQVNQKALPKAFEEACAGNICAPTTKIKMVNPKNNEFESTLYVWAKEFTGSADGTICFTELIEFNFKDGVMYTIGNYQGTCGAPMDVLLVHPVISPNNYIVAGGGAGKIVKGTHKFKDWKNGSYIDRVFVELTTAGAIENYSGLYFTLSPPKNDHH